MNSNFSLKTMPQNFVRIFGSKKNKILALRKSLFLLSM